MRCRHRRFFFLRAGPLATPIDHVETVRTGPARRASHSLFHATISFSSEVCPYYLTIWTLEPAAGIEPAYHLISLVPTAPSRRIAGLSRLSASIVTHRPACTDGTSPSIPYGLPRLGTRRGYGHPLVAGFRPPRPRLSGGPIRGLKKHGLAGSCRPGRA